MLVVALIIYYIVVLNLQFRAYKTFKSLYIEIKADKVVKKKCSRLVQCSYIVDWEIKLYLHVSPSCKIKLVGNVIQ